MPPATPPQPTPVFRLFGDLLGGEVAALLRLDPTLAFPLATAPARVFQAFGAFLQGPGALLPPATRARTLLRTDPRALLLEALPGRDRRLFRLLDQASLKERLWERSARPPFQREGWKQGGNYVKPYRARSDITHDALADMSTEEAKRMLTAWFTQEVKKPEFLEAVEVIAEMLAGQWDPSHGGSPGP